MGFTDGLLTSLFRAATPENPTFDLNSPAAWDALGATPSASGISISPKVALTLPAVWRAVNLLANGAAKTPLYVYRRQDERGKERAKEHPAYQRLRYKANEVMTSFVWKRTMMRHALLRGNGYSAIVRTGGAVLQELLPLDPDATFPVRENGRLWYVTTIDMGGGRRESRKLEPADVWHLKGFGADGCMGDDMVAHAKDALGVGVASQRYTAVYFKNAARASVVLTVPSKLQESAKKELTASWERMHAGIDNAHRTAILDNGMQVKEMTINARESQLIEQKKFTLIDMANLWGVPVHKIGGDLKQSYGSLEQENQSYLDDGLDPWLVNIEEESRDKLLTEREKEEDSHVIEFLREALVRSNLNDRANYYRQALGGAPWMIRNEVRNRENLNPIDGWDEPMDPLNMGNAGGDGQQKPPATPKPPAKPEQSPEEDEGGDGDEARPPTPEVIREVSPPESVAVVHRRILERAAARMVRRLGVHARRAAKDSGRFLAWLDSMANEHLSVVAEVLEDPLAAAAAALGRKHKAEDQAGLIVGMVHDGLLMLSGECKPAELADRVDGWMTKAEATWPALWAKSVAEDSPLGLDK